MRLAVYAGSFDPFTRGHGSVLSGALKAFDRVVIAVGHNSSKMAGGFSPLNLRKEMIRAVLEDELHVNFKPPRVPLVEDFDGLLINFCDTLLNRPIDGELPDSVTIVRGLRAVSDLETEMAIADANRRLSSRYATVFIPTEANLAFVSSSMVRELRTHRASDEVLAHYLHPSTIRFLKNGFR